MKSGNSLINVAAAGNKEAVERLACPLCGGSLVVSYGKHGPTRTKPEGYSSLSVTCPTCLEGITRDGDIEPPQWSDEGGGRIQTQVGEAQ
jgi:hypothetical protein